MKHIVRGEGPDQNALCRFVARAPVQSPLIHLITGSACFQGPWKRDGRPFGLSRDAQAGEQTAHLSGVWDIGQHFTAGDGREHPDSAAKHQRDAKTRLGVLSQDALHCSFMSTVAVQIGVRCARRMSRPRASVAGTACQTEQTPIPGRLFRLEVGDITVYYYSVGGPSSSLISCTATHAALPAAVSFQRPRARRGWLVSHWTLPNNLNSGRLPLHCFPCALAVCFVSDAPSGAPKSCWN